MTKYLYIFFLFIFIFLNVTTVHEEIVHNIYNMFLYA